MYGFEKDPNRTDNYGTSASGKKGWQDPVTGSFYEDKQANGDYYDYYEEPGPSGPSYSDIVEDGIENMKEECATALRDANTGFMSDAADVVGSIATGVGLVTLASQIGKTGDVSGAVGKAVRNALCVVGIIAMLLLMGVVMLFMPVTEDESVRTAQIVLGVIEVICVFNIIGFIRLMCNMPFLLFIKRRKNSVRDMIDNF